MAESDVDMRASPAADIAALPPAMPATAPAEIKPADAIAPAAASASAAVDASIVTAAAPAAPAAPSVHASAIAIASASRRLYLQSGGLGGPLSLPRAHRLLSERSSYAHASIASFRAALHVSPSRALQPPTAVNAVAAVPAVSASGKLVRGDSSPAAASTPAARSAAAQLQASQQPLSYAGEQALLHDAHAFLHTLSWGLRLPARVHADAAVALSKYCALVPLQQAQPFIIAPLPADDYAQTPGSSSPYGSGAGGLGSGSSSELAPLLSGLPPHGLYLLTTASLFLSAKAMDTPRKLNDFVDAYIALASILLRLRAKGPRRRTAAPSGLQALERVRALWKEFHSAHTTPPSTPPHPFAAQTPSCFHPATLILPSAAPSFAPSPEWTALRESVVYAEFLLLTHATEFAFNNALTCLDHEGREGSPFHVVQRLLWEMMDENEEESKSSDVEALSLSGVVASAAALAAPLRCSRLAWSLTHASLRSGVYLYSNAYVAAIAIVFLAAYAFRKSNAAPTADAASVNAPAASEPATNTASLLPSSTPVEVIDDTGSKTGETDVLMSDQPLSSPNVADISKDISKVAVDSSPVADAAAPASAEDVSAIRACIDLDACVDRKGWAPRFRVIDAHSTHVPQQTILPAVEPAAEVASEAKTAVSSASPSLCTHPLRWYHSLCPTMTDELLLGLCELIVEAAVAAPPMPSAAEDDSCAAEIASLAAAHPWGLHGDSSAPSASSDFSASHTWSNLSSQSVLVRSAQDTAFPYEEPFPRRVPRVMSHASPARDEQRDGGSGNAEDGWAARTNGRDSSSRSRRRRGRRGDKDRESRREEMDLTAEDAHHAAAALPSAPVAVPSLSSAAPVVAAAAAASAAAPAAHFIHPSRLGVVAHANMAPTSSQPSSSQQRHSGASVPAAAAASIPASANAPLTIAEQLAQAKEAFQRKRDELESKQQPSAPAASAAASSVRGASQSSRERAPHAGQTSGHSSRASSRSRSRSRSRSPRSRSPRRSSSRRDGPSSSSRSRPSYASSASSSSRQSGGMGRDQRERERERDRDWHAERDRRGGGGDARRDYRDESKRGRRSRSRSRDRGRDQRSAYPPPPLHPSQERAPGPIGSHARDFHDARGPPHAGDVRRGGSPRRDGYPGPPREHHRPPPPPMHADNIPPAHGQKRRWEETSRGSNAPDSRWRDERGPPPQRGHYGRR